MATRLKRVYCYVSKDVKSSIEAAAKKIDRSESWIINEALKSYLSPKPLKP